MNDLTYLKQGIFTAFFPESKAGEIAFQQILSTTEGTGKIYTMHLKSTLAQLKKAGYKVVKKTKKATKSDFQAIFKEMEILGI